MDIEKLFKEFVEKEWHDGHEPQGGYDHYDEDEEVEIEEEDEAYGGTKKWKKSQKDLKQKGYIHRKDRAAGWVEEDWKPIEEAFWKVNIPDMPPVFIEAGSASEIKSDMRKKLKGEVFKELGVERVSKTEMIKKYRSLAKGGDDKDFDTVEARTYLDRMGAKDKDKKAFGISRKKKDRGYGKKGGGPITMGDGVEEGVKDLPPHLQKLIKKIEKKQQDWNKKYPNAKIQTLVYNPETGKPDIVVKENTMKLVDTVKNIMEGELPPALQKAIDKKKGKKDDSEKDDSEVKKEDTDKDTPGTQGDMDEYQAKRKKIAKKFGVSSCSQLSGAKKKACYSALDKAHVADHEEQVELEKMKTEETKEQKSFSKLFSHLKGMMKEKKKKMLKGYASKY